MDKPINILDKKLEVGTNKIIIPKKFADLFGYQYKMEVYEDKIILIPLKKQEGN